MIRQVADQTDSLREYFKTTKTHFLAIAKKCDMVVRATHIHYLITHYSSDCMGLSSSGKMTVMGLPLTTIVSSDQSTIGFLVNVRLADADPV